MVLFSHAGNDPQRGRLSYSFRRFGFLVRSAKGVFVMGEDFGGLSLLFDHAVLDPDDTVAEVFEGFR